MHEIGKKEMAYNKSSSAPRHSYQDQDSTFHNKFQVYLNDITWNPKQTSSYQVKKDKTNYGALPRQMTFDIPETVLEQARKDPKNFNDVIESFIYNTLTRKFMHEVYCCQIWLLD